MAGVRGLELRNSEMLGRGEPSFNPEMVREQKPDTFSGGLQQPNMKSPAGAGCRCYCYACRIDSNAGAESTNGGPEWEFAPH